MPGYEWTQDTATTYVHRLFEHFGLYDWTVNVHLADNYSIEGQAQIDERYKRVHISGHSANKDDDLGRILLHETLHTVLWEMDLTVRQHIVHDLIPEKRIRKHAQELFTDALEHTLITLVDSLYPFLQPGDDAWDGANLLQSDNFVKSSSTNSIEQSTDMVPADTTNDSSSLISRIGAKLKKKP